jgi:hypothetical protein
MGLSRIARHAAHVACEILRRDKHLCRMRDDAPRERRAGRRKTRNQANSLSRAAESSQLEH